MNLSYTGFAYYLKEMYGYDSAVFIRQGNGHITLYYPAGKTMIMELNDNAIPNNCVNVYTCYSDLLIVLTGTENIPTKDQKDKYNLFIHNCIQQWSVSGSTHKHCSISQDDFLRGNIEIDIKDNKKILCYCPQS